MIILAYAALGLALAASGAFLMLAFWVRRKLQAVEEKTALSDTLPQKWTELESGLKGLEERIVELETSRTPAAEWFADTGAVNLNSRGQVLRLHRRGESADHIASLLGLSHGEVKLIIKVHELSRSDPAPGKSEPRKADPLKSEPRSLNPWGMIDRGYTGPPKGGSKI